MDSRAEVVGRLTATNATLWTGFAIPIATVLAQVGQIERGSA